MKYKFFCKVLLIIFALIYIFKVNSYATSEFTYTLDSNNNAIITGYNGTSSDIVIPSTIDGHNVKSIGKHAFDKNASLSKVTIGEGITSIDDFAFVECTNLESIKLPNTLTSLGDQTFVGCNKLKTINIPSSLKSFRTYVFQETGFTEFTIPDGFQNIGDCDFRLCSKLKDFKVYSRDVKYSEDVFEHCSSSLTLYGYEDSTTQKYAKENGLNFKSLSNENKTVDFSNAKFNYKSKNLANLEITISDYKIDETKGYYAYISKNKNEDKEVTKYRLDFAIVDKNKDGTLRIGVSSSMARKALETIGTNYIHIIENHNEEYNIIATKEIPSMPLPDLGLRLDIYLYDPKETLVINSVQMSEDRKIEYRIGKVTSNDILKSLKKDSSSVAFNNLLKYAKSADYIATGTVTTEGLNYSIINKLNIEKGAYYFVYMVVENENGQYIDIEDVAIYTECNTKEGNALIHFDFADIKIDESTNNGKNDPKDDGKDDPTVAPDNKLPQTGISYIIIIPIVVVTASGVIYYIKYKKI